MIWIPQQELTLETPTGIKLYTHPNGSIYAQCFLESFMKAVPEFAGQVISEESFTRMIVMPEGVVLSLSANKEMSTERLQEMIDSIVNVKSNYWSSQPDHKAGLADPAFFYAQKYFFVNETEKICFIKVFEQVADQ